MIVRTALGAFAFSSLVLFSTTASHAADPLSEMFDWNGLYAGVQVGYGTGTDFTNNENIVSGATDHREHIDVDGIIGGLHVGYNHQMNNILLGVEADAEFSGIGGNTDNYAFGDTIDSDIDAMGSVRLRAGYTMDNSLVYLTGGLALGAIDAEYTEGALVDSRNNIELGYTLGAGFEHAFNEAWSLRAEYRFTQFAPLVGENVLTDTGWDYHDKFKIHAVRFGVSYHF